MLLYSMAIGTVVMLAACADDAPSGRTPPMHRDEGDSHRAGAAVPQVDPTLGRYYASLRASHGVDLAHCPRLPPGPRIDCPTGPLASSRPPRRVLLLLDASYAMASPGGPVNRFPEARGALRAFVSRLDAGTQVAVRVFGHRGRNTAADMPDACLATDSVLPFSPPEIAKFDLALRTVEPSGRRPLAATLHVVAREFGAAGADADRTVVYLLAGGSETCGGDPAAAARALRASARGVALNVVGYGADDAAVAQLREVAQAGGGAYRQPRFGRTLMELLGADPSSVRAEFACRTGPVSPAARRQADAFKAHFDCVVDASLREYVAVTRAADADFEAGRSTPAQRQHVLDRASADSSARIRPLTEGRYADPLKGSR